MGAAPTVCLVGSDRGARATVSRALEPAGLTMAWYASVDDCLRHAKEGNVGCLLLDADGLDGDTADLIRRLSDGRVHVPILVISGRADVQAAIRIMKAGAADFIEKPLDGATLVDRVQRVLAIGQMTREDRTRRDEAFARWTSLTPREHEVATLVVTGLCNKTIGMELGISQKTVEAHRAKVMRKMGAGSLAELVRQAILAGVCSAGSPSESTDIAGRSRASSRGTSACGTRPRGPATTRPRSGSAGCEF